MLLLLLALLLPPGTPEGGPTGETSGGWAAQPHVALAETQPGSPGGPLILENFELPAAPSGSGHVPATLSTPNASSQDRSRQRRNVPPKSHWPAGTHGLCTKAKVLLRQVDPATDMAKTPRGLWAALLRLVRLAGALGKCRPVNRYKWFLTQHVDESDSWDPADTTKYCNEMMTRINCGSKGPQCKEINTFIRAPEDAVRAVCQTEKGRHIEDNIYASNKTFNLTICRRTELHNTLSCMYQGERTIDRVQLGCNRQGQPVHFQCVIGNPPYRHERCRHALGHAAGGTPATRQHTGEQPGMET